MTRNEAIDLLDNLIGMVDDNHDSDYDTALQMGIKALEQEPCEDAISRKAVLQAVSKGCQEWRGIYRRCEEFINALPSVRPQLCEDAISREGISKPTGIEFDEEQEQIDFVPSYKSTPCKIKVQAGVSDTNVGEEDIDIEIRNLVRYLNMVDGIETIESCFGHNESPCFIWFKADSIKAINDMVFNIFDNDYLWKIEIDNQDFHSDYKELRFVLSSGEIKDFPTVNLMVDNLTYRLEKWLAKRKR